MSGYRAGVRLRLALLISSLVVFVPAPGARAQVDPAAPKAPGVASGGSVLDCASCHSQELDSSKPCVFRVLLEGSVHAGMDCTDCHASVTVPGADGSGKPHEIGPVNCGFCHEEEAEVYKKHGRGEVGKTPDIPECWHCHGAHDVLTSTDPRARVHPVHLARTCMVCHTDVDLVKRHDLLAAGPIALYESSVHGQTSKGGLFVRSTCNDCHSATDPDGQRTAHRILGPADPESTLYHFNIPNTCGRCHKSVAADYGKGVHGQLVERGEVDSPVCTTCHGEHGIMGVSDPRSPVSVAKVAAQTCAPCHESVTLNEKYGIPGGRLTSYVDSYHGRKAKAGNVKVANCASCHGAHRILPSDDPTSSIYPKNLPKTCGECHPGISPEMAATGIHTTATGLKTGWPEFFRVLYLWIIGVTIGLMLLHNIAHYVRSVKQLRKKPFIVRLTVNETLQHWLLMISFIVLVVSGFSLRFSESWWSQLLFGWGDGKGFEIRGLVHRIAAVVMILSSVWHLVYLFSARGRHMFREMILSTRDPRNVWENALYFLGMRDSEARHGRFTYMEKCEYWALVWGTVIMTGTGILLWFDNYFTQWWKLPKGFLDVMLVIHYYEAWLATLAIFVWHIYGTVFSPSAYPMNPAWIDGRMPKGMYEHEHPEGPRLKGHIVISHIAEEEEVEHGAKPTGSSAAKADRSADADK